jgi:hypothetical protein
MASIPSEPIAVGGGALQPNKRGHYYYYYYLFYNLFYYLFVFYANPLPSSIPPPLNLHNRQVDDCVAGNEEVLIEGVEVEVEVEAEEGTEDIGVGQNNYEEPSLVALFDLLERCHISSALRLFADRCLTTTPPLSFTPSRNILQSLQK